MIVAVLKGYERLASLIPQVQQWVVEILVIALFTLFCLSYRKQCHYITNRIHSILKRKEDDHG
jgi:hypothetical protein